MPAAQGIGDQLDRRAGQACQRTLIAEAGHQDELPRAGADEQLPVGQLREPDATRHHRERTRVAGDDQDEQRHPQRGAGTR